MSDVDDIKARLDIVQVIGEYLPLKKSGTSHKAPCPFHHEKTPSFYVSAERQAWHCFGCGEGGDAFDFVMRLEGMDFKEALAHLAQKAGVELKTYSKGGGHGDSGSEKGKILEANALAAKFYHQVLLRMAGPATDIARAYVKKRGLTAETVRGWEVGFAPEGWDNLRQALAKRGFGDDVLDAAGLLSKNERGGKYDRFRGRIMFPIRDSQGRTLGFAGRVLPLPDGTDPKDVGKYVNSPETAVYKKARVLFGLDKAKGEIRKQGVAVVVEGNLDAITCHQAGFANVVASSGTAFTDEQLAILRRFCDRLVLSFDNDAAGDQAVRRSIDLAVAAGFAVRVLRLPPGMKDPDDCVRKDPAAWEQAVKNAVPYLQWYLDQSRAELLAVDSQVRGGAADAFLAEVAKLSGPVEQSHWVRELAMLTKTPESLVFEALRKRGGADGQQGMARAQAPSASQSAAPAQMNPVAARKDRFRTLAEVVVGAALAWPELRAAVDAAGIPELLPADLATLYKPGGAAYARADGDMAATMPEAPASASAVRAACLVAAEREFGSALSSDRLAAISTLATDLKKLHRERRQRELMLLMAKAESAGDQESIVAIQRELQLLVR
jgi:DNA primase